MYNLTYDDAHDILIEAEGQTRSAAIIPATGRVLPVSLEQSPCFTEEPSQCLGKGSEPCRTIVDSHRLEKGRGDDLVRRVAIANPATNHELSRQDSQRGVR
jgi:hypothetical protein